MTETTRNERVTAWRHARAIALLPFMNTVVIPSVLLAAFPPVLSLSATAVVGAALVAGGVTLVAHTSRLFVRFGQGTLAPWDATRALVNAGAYGCTRNPMKSGLFLVLSGEALLTRSAPLAAWFVCFALANVLYIRLHEEPGLAARFGDRYRDYCARVPRWWPRLRALRRRVTEVNPT
jgi:protein-S-isoprenylcysteine O-methyltransferase Ste14